MACRILMIYGSYGTDSLSRHKYVNVFHQAKSLEFWDVPEHIDTIE